MLQGGSELNTAQYPVNQQIVLGEPVMSENDPTVGVQWGDIARGKSDREVGCFSDYSGGGTVEQTENDWRDSIA